MIDQLDLIEDRRLAPLMGAEAREALNVTLYAMDADYVKIGELKHSVSLYWKRKYIVQPMVRTIPGVAAKTGKLEVSFKEGKYDKTLNQFDLKMLQHLGYKSPQDIIGKSFLIQPTLNRPSKEGTVYAYEGIHPVPDERFFENDARLVNLDKYENWVVAMKVLEEDPDWSYEEGYWDTGDALYERQQQEEAIQKARNM